MTRALLVVDVQREYDGTGALPIQHPPLKDSLTQIGRAMDAARAAGILVVVIQHDSPAGAPAFAVGSEGWELFGEVADRHRDVLLHKTLPSAFAGTDLERRLRDHGVDTVTVVGYMTQHCVDSTARQAMHLGFRVEILSDATGTLGYANDAGRADARQLHETQLTGLHAGIAAVGPTGDWLAAIQRGAGLTADDPISSAATAALR